MNAVHVNEMDNPAKNFPRAIGLATIIILLVFIFLTQGVLQAFDVFFAQLGMPWGTTVMALLIVVGILASVVTWIPGPSKGLLMVGREGYLPKWLQKTNDQDMQVNIMIVQGVIVTVLALCVLDILSDGRAAVPDYVYVHVPGCNAPAQDEAGC